MRVVVRVLAFIGAVSLLLVAGAAVWLWSVSRPATEPATRPGVSATAGGATPSDLRNVRGTIAGLARSGEATVLEGVDAVGVVPFAVVEQRVGGGARLSHDGEGHVRVEAPVSALGRAIDVQAVGAVRAEGNEVVIDPVSVGLGVSGVLESALGDVARRAVTIREPIADLPPGLQVTKIDVADDGFHVHVVGDRVSTG